MEFSETQAMDNKKQAIKKIAGTKGYRLNITSTFDDRYMHIKKKGKDDYKLISVIYAILINTLPPNQSIQIEHGRYKGELLYNIEANWVLVYQIKEDILTLLNTGTHDEVFGI